MKARRVSLLLGPMVAGAALVLVRPVGAQDIEALARTRGLELPEAYYRSVRRDPTAFTFSRALFQRSEIGRTSAVGSVRLPVVLALFADSQEPHITRDMVQASLFDGPSVHGTVTEAYLEMSRGVLNVGGDVLPWVRTSYTMTEVVGDGDGLGTAADIGDYFTEALDLLDAEVDFSRYDNDGPDGLADSGDDDGFVDVITFEYLEIAASCGGPAIWPHRWSMTGRTGAPYETDDIGVGGEPILINDYITQSVADCSGQVVQDASTIAHEFGHALGLPDYYHPTGGDNGPHGRRWVLGCWALMAGGAWGCGPVDDSRPFFGPTHLMAHSKHQLGWLDYLTVGAVWNEEVVLDPVQASGMALRIPLGDRGTEFLIAEYREQTGFDEALPASGVVMYKQDLAASRRPDPAGDEPYFLTLLERDGNQGLVRNFFQGGNRGEPGDAWGVGEVSGALHAESTPALRLSEGDATPVTVHEVSVVDGRAHIVVSTAPTPRLVPPPGEWRVEQVVSFLESVRIAGGTMPYTASVDAPEGFFVTAGGDQLYVAGSVTEPGPFELRLSIRDAVGNESDEISVTLTAPTEWTVETDDLLGRFLQSDGEPLTPGELHYLDERGNRNGTYDIGDLRRWLGENGPPKS